MNCPEARKILYPGPAKCGVTIDTGRAMEHLRECPECRSYFQGQTEWAAVLKDRLRGTAAPEALRQRIEKQVQGRRLARSSRRRRYLPVAAAALAFLLLAAGWVGSRVASERFFRSVCDDHAKYVNAESQVASSDPGVLETWLRGKTEFGVRVPLLQNAQLLGARLCFLRSRKAALIFYRKNGRAVSLFEFKGQGLHLGVLERAVIDGAPLWRLSYNGFSLAVFEHRGITYALVSDLRESELLELAAAAQAGSHGN